MAAFCQEKSWPILMHLGGDGETGNYRYLPERHPGLKIIYAHAAVPYYQEIWFYAKNRENIFVDLSSTVFMNEEILEAVIEFLGIKKCLYGTDGPYAYANQERMVNRIHRLNISGNEKEYILSANFLEIINAYLKIDGKSESRKWIFLRSA